MKPDEIQKKYRKIARGQILAAANRGVDAKSSAYLHPKHIQRAVFRCRQRKLVKDAVLVVAGYNPTKRR